MKRISLVLVIISFIFSSCGDAQNDAFLTTTSRASLDSSLFQCSLYGPYTIDDEDQNIEMSYKCDNTNTFEVVQFRERGKRTPFYQRSISNHVVDAKKRIHFNFTLPVSDVLLDDGIDVYIFVYDQKNMTVIYEKSFTLLPKQTLTINSKENKTYVIENTMFSFPYTTATTCEQYDFTNTVETFQNNDYYTLPLSGISFTYRLNEEDFSYKECYLTTDDPHSFFVNCRKNGIVKIPLKCNSSFTVNVFSVTFDYLNLMYFDKNSLSMSLTSLYGYQQTNKFYMPRSKGKEMDETQFKIVIEGAGRNNTKIIIPLTYYSLRNHFGNCDDSDYCVRGGILE